MGAPAGHPFFGNQYTDGGYAIGSFSYKNVIENVAEVAAKAVPKILPNNSASDSLSGALLKASPSPRLSSGSIAGLVAAGAVFLAGGVATFVYLSSRTKSTGDQQPAGDDLAGFGLCESCGEELAVARPAEVEQDEDGYFIICEACSHKNRAHYSSGDESDVSDNQ